MSEEQNEKRGQEDKPLSVPAPTGSLPKTRPMPQSQGPSTEPVAAVDLDGLVSDAAAHQARATELAAKQRAFEAEKERQRQLLEQEQQGSVEDEIEAATAPLTAKILRAEAFGKAQQEAREANGGIVTINAKRRELRRRILLVGAVILTLGIALWGVTVTVMGGW